jgi:hypothetical protein
MPWGYHICGKHEGSPPQVLDNLNDIGVVSVGKLLLDAPKKCIGQLHSQCSRAIILP